MEEAIVWANQPETSLAIQMIALQPQQQLQLQQQQLLLLPRLQQLQYKNLLFI